MIFDKIKFDIRCSSVATLQTIHAFSLFGSLWTKAINLWQLKVKITEVGTGTF